MASLDGHRRTENCYVITCAGRRLRVKVAMLAATPAPRRCGVVFFLHGTGGRAEQWRMQFAALHETQTHHLVACDMLGHGLSHKPEGAYEYADTHMLRDLFYLVDLFCPPLSPADELGGDEAVGGGHVLVAHSYGGGLALRLLAAHEREGRRTFQSCLLLGPAHIHRPIPLLPHLPVWVLERLRPLISSFFGGKAWHSSTPASLKEEEAAVADENPMGVIQGLIAGWRGVPETDLARIRTSVQLLVGEEDGLTTPTEVRALHCLLRGSTFEVVEEAGHMLMLEQAERVNTAILRLMGS